VEREGGEREGKEEKEKKGKEKKKKLTTVRYPNPKSSTCILCR
jgi:hypothetical protein